MSLLDIHPGRSDVEEEEEGKLEIFEAGTGHGSLTLHLARAVHGANTPAPKIPPQREPDAPAEECEQTYLAWKATRKAVIHSLDNSNGHSKRAQEVVREFRRGMYFPNVDFHVGKIEEYISLRLTSNDDRPFLSHAVLDLPDPSLYLEIFGRALSPLGKLLTFNPSITQTVKCLQVVEKQKLPFVLDKVLEVGTSAGSGGRLWDVRSVVPRSIQRNAKAAEVEPPSAPGEEVPAATGEETESPEDTATGSDSEIEASPEISKEIWEIVCRPKAGVKAEGGGFVGVWRRKHFLAEDSLPGIM